MNVSVLSWDKSGLANEQHAQRVTAAMRGHGTACTRDEYLIKRSDGLDLLDASVDDLVCTACVRDEDAVRLDVRGVAHAVSDVGLKTSHKLAAVLLANAHFAVLHDNTGLEREQIGTDLGNGRATTALM